MVAFSPVRPYGLMLEACDLDLRLRCSCLNFQRPSSHAAACCRLACSYGCSPGTKVVSCLLAQADLEIGPITSWTAETAAVYAELSTLMKTLTLRLTEILSRVAVKSTTMMTTMSRRHMTSKKTADMSTVCQAASLNQCPEPTCSCCTL